SLSPISLVAPLQFSCGPQPTWSSSSAWSRHFASSSVRRWLAPLPNALSGRQRSGLVLLPITDLDRSRQVFDDGQITSRQLPQHPYAGLAMVDRFELIAAQQLRQLAGIDPITLVPVFEQRILPGIAHHQFVNVRVEQIVQPNRPGSFLEGH